MDACRAFAAIDHLAPLMKPLSGDSAGRGGVLPSLCYPQPRRTDEMPVGGMHRKYHAFLDR